MADSKVTALTELTAFTGDETFYVVEDDDGTPVSRRMTVENLAAALAARAELTGAFAPLYFPGKLLGYDEVTAFETRSGNTFADITTVGPSVTFTVPTGQTWVVLAEYAVRIGPGTATGIAAPKLDSTDIPNDDNGAASDRVGNYISTASMAKFTGLTAGSHTIKLQYRSSSGNTDFDRRRLKVSFVSN